MTAEAALSAREYDSLLDAAETYREVLVVRCCGEVGLRPAELAALTVGDVEQVRIDPPRYVVRVPATGGRTGHTTDTDDTDGTDNIDGTQHRTAYLPTGVEQEIRRYARSNDLSADDHLFDVTPRRLQMLVAEVATRASERFDRPALADASSSDLRHYFARRSLVDHDINPRAVKAAGGWQSFEALESYLPEPSDTALVDAFETVERPSTPRLAGAGGSGRTGRPMSDDGVVRLLLAASDRYALVRLDEEGYVERWNRSAAALFGYRAGEIVGTHVSAFYTDEAVDDGVPEQTLSTALEKTGTEQEGWRVHSDGSRFRATEVISPLRDDRGRHDGYAVFVRDSSAQHEVLESVRAERNELRRAVAVGERYRAVTAALLEASDHEAVEAMVCEALAAGEGYAFSWIDRTTGFDREGRRTTSGERGGSEVDAATVERLAPAEWANGEREGPDDSSTYESESESGVAVTTVTDEQHGNELCLASVSLTYGDTTYGRLGVATSRADAFAADEQQWLATAGRQVGYAITAVRRRNLLLSDRVVELDVRCQDARSFFVAASQQLGCRFELESLVPISESTQLYYLRLEDAPPAEVFDLAADDPGIDDCRLLETDPDGWRIEVVVEGSSPARTLTEYGLTVLEAVTENGTTTITAESAAETNLRTVLEGLRSTFPSSTLLGKREAERTVQTAREFREGLEERLTERQVTALRAAYFGGYYDWPRESTAEEVADAMGISSPTLHNHLRKAQHELLRTFFGVPAEGHTRETGVNADTSETSSGSPST
ncbi:bacterio-opsin activator domain-containing protein [Natrialba sp. SSL1]|uniref:bacterio-opsin activator domain-containing protein n=1 Tax=Natrialba sp. SSL1 TaxID=1869245 RepID=UPI0008F97374|nr:bacterio-opsin activator domain-containing protein [Natrialba sp. SSL1]OIB57047.1 histidine kinase [Natrialba sp. SSL1]